MPLPRRRPRPRRAVDVDLDFRLATGPRPPPAPPLSSEESDSEFAVEYSTSSDEDFFNEPAPPLPRPVPFRRPHRAKRKRARSSNASEQGSSSGTKWKEWEERHEEWLSRMEGGSRLEGDGRGVAEIVEPAPQVVLPLLRFQKEWLAWALKQEDSDARGGILADEMGMGKTIQAISLVLTARELHRGLNPSGKLQAMGDCVGATLVICPVVALVQWAEEINRHTEKGSARVLLYHGPNRERKGFDFADYDFVITTYSTIEADYRKNMMPRKERCNYCNKAFYPDKLKFHEKYYCGPDATRTEKQSKQHSKKKSVLQEGKLDDPLKGGHDKVHRAKKRKGSNMEEGCSTDNGLQDQDETASKEGSSQKKSPLHSVRWERIILDEAHYIKDRRCNTARSVFALQSIYKWALSGTPLQNRVGELYSLIRFLRIFPYSYFFCKDCNCELLDHSAKHCVECFHSSARHFCWWNKYITNPVQSGNKLDLEKAMTLLRDKILKGIVIRRTKKGRATDLALPPRIVTLRRDSLDRLEKEFYEALYTQTRVQFDSYVAAGTVMNNYAHIFDLLTRLRQAVDHPYLVVYSKTAEQHNDGNEDNSIVINCGICNLPVDDMVVTACGHSFCKDCLANLSENSENVLCPSCAKPLTVDLIAKKPETSEIVNGAFKNSILSRLKNTSDFKTSTKIDALKEEIRNMVEDDRSAKGIVFSQFTSFLDLIQFSLQRSGIKCVRLVGSMSVSERQKSIQSFINDPDCKIFLMSLKAGGVALNLTVASHVFLMDPWWNPAVENQAQDRIHRIGQHKPIRSVRFVIEDTVEERILQLQEKKRLVFEGTVGDSSEAMSKLTEADMRFLFNM